MCNCKDQITEFICSYLNILIKYLINNSLYKFVFNFYTFKLDYLQKLTKFQQLHSNHLEGKICPNIFPKQCHLVNWA